MGTKLIGPRERSGIPFKRPYTSGLIQGGATQEPPPPVLRVGPAANPKADSTSTRRIISAIHANQFHDNRKEMTFPWDPSLDRVGHPVSIVIPLDEECEILALFSHALIRLLFLRCGLELQWIA